MRAWLKGYGGGPVARHERTPVTTDDLTALVLVCTLKRSPAPSSSDKIGRDVLDALGQQGVHGEVVRVVDHDVRFGVTTDEGDGDGWPGLRRRLLAAQLLVVATPIWLGQPSSVCKLVLERLDAELAETDDQGRMSMAGKVAMVAVVGNEDGAHHVVAECLQALTDVGFSAAPTAGVYWVGEAMGSTDYLDLDQQPAQVAETITASAGQAAHLADLLRDRPYPAPGS
jgi:multimeric flavodoxin WrbA